MALGNWGWGGGWEKQRKGEEFLQLRPLIPAARCQEGPSQEYEMPLQTLLPLSLFRPFKNIRSILGGEKVSFPSPSPAALSPKERGKNKTTPKPLKRHKNPKRGRRWGEAPGRAAAAGGAEERGCPGPGRLRAPRASAAPRSPKRSPARAGGGARAVPRAPAGSPGSAQRAQRGCSPRLSAGAGRPAGPLGSGDWSWGCARILRAAGARAWAKRLGFTLPKTHRRRGSLPSRPHRLIPPLPPPGISPGRALKEDYFSQKQPLPTP